MPRKQKEILIPIQGPLPYRKDHLYSGKITGVKSIPKGNQLLITIIHDDPEQDGRKLTIPLPLPARPDNQTFQFLKACGIQELTEGKSIDAAKLLSVRIGLRIVELDKAGNPKTILFEPEKASVTPEKD